MSHSVAPVVARSYRRGILAALFGSVVCFPAAIARQPAATKDAPKPPLLPATVRRHAATTYCQHVSGPLQLDLVCPAAGKGPFPAAIILHGGGWLQGNRGSCLPLAVKLAEAGYVAVPVSYRLTLVDPFPAQVEDVHCAVRWLRANAGKYNIDRQRIGAVGYSAGGNLACMLGLTGPLDGFDGHGGHRDQSGSVRCVVSYYGLSDLDPLFQAVVGGKVRGWLALGLTTSLQQYLSGTPQDVLDRYHKASPIRYAHVKAAPTLLIHGTGDELIPCDQSERLYRKLKSVKADVTLLKLEDAPHAFTGHFEELADAATLRFLERHLKPRAKLK